MRRLVLLLALLTCCGDVRAGDDAARYDAAKGSDAMALPLTRNTTYAPLSQVLSADLNDIQDQIIAGNFGANRKLSQAMQGMGPGGGTPEGTLVTPTGRVRLAPGDEWMVWLDVHPGDTINDIFATVHGTALDNVDMQFSRNGALVGANLNHVFVGSAVAERTASIAFGGPYTVEDPSASVGDGAYSLLFSNGGAANVDIYTIDYEVERDQ